jgi:hypothetical protein
LTAKPLECGREAAAFNQLKKKAAASRPHFQSALQRERINAIYKSFIYFEKYSFENKFYSNLRILVKAGSMLHADLSQHTKCPYLNSDSRISSFWPCMP